MLCSNSTNALLTSGLKNPPTFASCNQRSFEIIGIGLVGQLKRCNVLCGPVRRFAHLRQFLPNANAIALPWMVWIFSYSSGGWSGYFHIPLYMLSTTDPDATIPMASTGRGIPER